MNLLADESVDQPIVDRLREDGHEVHAVAEMDPGIPDEAVLTLANQQEAMLLTRIHRGESRHRSNPPESLIR